MSTAETILASAKARVERRRAEIRISTACAVCGKLCTGVRSEDYELIDPNDQTGGRVHAACQPAGASTSVTTEGKADLTTKPKRRVAVDMNPTPPCAHCKLSTGVTVPLGYSTPAKDRPWLHPHCIAEFRMLKKAEGER